MTERKLSRALTRPRLFGISRPKLKVIKDYFAQDEFELSLKKGEILTYLGADESGWIEAVHDTEGSVDCNDFSSISRYSRLVSIFERRNFIRNRKCQ